MIIQGIGMSAQEEIIQLNGLINTNIQVGLYHDLWSHISVFFFEEVADMMSLKVGQIPEKKA